MMLSIIGAFLLLGVRFSNAAPALEGIYSCLSAAHVPQELPGSEDFTQDIIPYNLRVNFTPIALAVPQTVPQVQAAVKCAAEYGIKVNPKSGGHSYAGHSIGGEDGHLVIDLKYFDDVTVDTASNVATVGPGARLGNLALALYNQGGRAIAHGICPGSEYSL
jgi:FAD/FMN-containing dehydrogenase